ncbi:MAG: hypothetical protein QM346_11300, partial [Chloroflexota bacterium]|nr:hypothetical protein [Chloroflexota bacterium]
MISRILSVLLSAAILLTATLPAHAAPPAQGQSQASLSFGETPPFALQGEIVYVVDGNLVLHDLATGATRQLTDDGLAMLPAWSPDGRYVTYSSGYDLDSSDLHVLDIGTGESRLLAEDACCATWAPEGERIIFLAVGGDAMYLDAIDADGADRATFSPLYNIVPPIYPAGRLRWITNFDDAITIPLEVIDLEGGFGVVRVVLSLEIGPDGLTTGIADGGGVAECQFLDFAGNVVAYAGNDCPDRFDVDSEGLSWTRGLIHIERAFDLPWLGAPDWSPNGAQLVAERYLPSDDPLAAPLWGVVVYDIASRTQWDLVEGAAQPAWRPDTPA